MEIEVDFKPRRPEAYARAQVMWLTRPEHDRSGGRIAKDLAEEGMDVARPTVCRWAAHWRKSAEDGLGICNLPPPAPDASADLSDVPDWAKETLPERLLMVAGGKGLDRVENAAAIYADAIAASTPALVDQMFTSEQRLMLAVRALASIAAVMQRVIQARALVAKAHRAFCEGDKAAAEAKKARAESPPHKISTGMKRNVQRHTIRDEQHLGEHPPMVKERTSCKAH